MTFEIRSAGKRFVLAGILLSGVAIYVSLTASQVISSQLSQIERLHALRWAIRLDPLNAEYRDKLARFELLVEQSPAAALVSSRTATALNPNRANYWLDRAVAEQLTGDFNSERISLTRAHEANPYSTGLAWEAGNLYLAQGANEAALREYRKVMENDPQLVSQAIQVCWKILPDVDYLLTSVVPVNAEKPLLSFLISNQQSAAAAKVWEKIASSRQPVERPFLLEYLRYLVANHGPSQAARVWQQAAELSDLGTYQPTDDNLLVNGDFSLPILNGGFDWTYQKSSAVALALDPNEGHSGARSLRISFEGPGIVDAGIRQLVSVEPNTQYVFSGYYQAREMDGAGGPKFAIEDAYTAAPLFMSDALRDAEVWTQVDGTFTTGPDTRLAVLRIARVPASSPIRGKLWIDDLKLVTAAHFAALQKEQP